MGVTQDAHKDAVLNSVRAAAAATKRERELDALPAVSGDLPADLPLGLMTV